MAAMKRALAAVTLLAAAAPATAALTAEQLSHAVARPPRAARLPATLPFTDQRGAVTTLGAVADGRPLVLLFADYTCRHICAPGATLATAALRDTGLAAGQDYALAIVGLDPRDGVDAARDFARHIAAPGVARATSLLSGSPRSIAAAERALGYRTAYDADSDQFAHDASVYVFGRDGRLVTLLPELGLRPLPLRAALAGRLAPATFGERIAHLCYGLAAASGRFAAPAVLALQALAGLTLAGLALFLWRRRHA